MKILLLLPLLLGFSVPAIAHNEANNNYQNSYLLISYGGGGGGGSGSGGGNSLEGKAKKKARMEKAKLLFKKNQALKKVSEGIPLTEEEKEILNIDSIKY